MPTDYFLKLEGVDGASTAEGHRGEIDLGSFTWGETNVSRAGAGGGKVAMQDFHFTTLQVSRASPVLMKACAAGTHFPTAVLTAERPGGDGSFKFYVVTLDDVMLTEYSVAGSAEAPAPVDQFSMSFAKIIVQHISQDPDGSDGLVVTEGWDLGKNKGI